MSRYFNADVFLKNVKQKAYPQNGSVNESERKISLFGIMEILTTIPMEDVVPVVHGKWVLNDDQVYECKDCGYVPSFDGYTYFNYCPNCGAKMGGDEFCSNKNQKDLGKQEIIPCKKCKWHGYLTCSNPEGIKGWVTDNDFCSYVEERENVI